MDEQHNEGNNEQSKDPKQARIDALKEKYSHFARDKKKLHFLICLEQAFGNISKACENANNISRRTFYNWIKEDSEFAEAVEDIEESLIDFAESKLLVNINNGDVTSIIFFLKKKGKKRGYGDDAAVLKIDKTLSVEKGFSLDDILDESQIEHLKNLRNPSK